MSLLFPLGGTSLLVTADNEQTALFPGAGPPWPLPDGWSTTTAIDGWSTEFSATFTVPPLPSDSGLVAPYVFVGSDWGIAFLDENGNPTNTMAPVRRLCDGTPRAVSGLPVPAGSAWTVQAWVTGSDINDLFGTPAPNYSGVIFLARAYYVAASAVQGSSTL